MKNQTGPVTKFSIICPTLNAGDLWNRWIESVLEQDLNPQEIIIIDSESTDTTAKLAKDNGFRVEVSSRKKFDHGGTRNMGVEMLSPDNNIVVFLTQDAVLADPSSLRKILAPFNDPDVAAVCGRQLPHKEATPIEAHARIFNYSDTSRIKSRRDIGEIGIKTAFMSNSFAAYKCSVFNKVGKFPSNTIFAEDMSLAAKMILNGYKVAYASEAQVYHSHSYSILQEFKRYFDVGVFYKREEWIMQEFGGVGGEGIRFLVSEIKFLKERGRYLLILNSIIRNGLKFLAFKLGSMEKFIPKRIKRIISMNRNYWK